MIHQNLRAVFNQLPPWWSDHAYQSMNFQVKDPTSRQSVYSVCAGSWNIQDRCLSTAMNPRGYHNNPFDHDELDDNEYKLRKEAQISKIEEKIQNGGDDIVFLQEIDFLTAGGQLNVYLQKRLKATLAANGYGMVISAKPNPGDIAQQRMATIYNKTKLKLVHLLPDAPRGVLPTNITPTFTQYRGFETTFTILESGLMHGKKLVATNLHLKFGVDYMSAIEQYQKEMERNDVLHIMGGDTNNVQNEHLNTALGDWNFATNFSDTNEIPPTLTVVHSDHMKKAYDNFFVVPPQAHYVTAQTVGKRCEYVEIDPQGFVHCQPNHNEHTSESRVGERWRRGVDILHELEEKFINTSNSTAKKQYLAELCGVIKSKNIASWSDKIMDAGLRQDVTSYLQMLVQPARDDVTSSARLLVPAASTKIKTKNQIDAEYNFNVLLNDILKKEQQFKKNKDTDAENAAHDLHTALQTASGVYFKSELNQNSYDTFNESCDDAIETARDTLQHHRGWKDFVAKVALALVCILIPAALAISSKIRTGHWNFRLFKTDSSKKLDEVLKHVSSMSPQ